MFTGQAAKLAKTTLPGSTKMTAHLGTSIIAIWNLPDTWTTAIRL